MRIFNFGSLNIDHVYTVEHFVQPGETLASLEYRKFVGGKGLNQSVALANAGADVVHVGRIGREGAWLKRRLAKSGADVSLIEKGDEPTGHAIIQVDKKGENSIITYGGANRALDETDVDALIAAVEPGDFVLMQNEATCLGSLIEKAFEKKLLVVFNPGPMTASVNELPLEKVGMLIINENEGERLTGISDPEEILMSLLTRYPTAKIVLTLGANGVRYKDSKHELSVAAEKVEAVDTTGAGDTFIGYFLAEYAKGVEVEACLKLACKASAVCVKRKGAADSIPLLSELV